MTGRVRWGVGVAWLALVLVGGGMTGCRGGDEGQDEVVEHAVELPPMSEGTIQALGPHVFTGETTVAPDAGSSRKASADRQELRWQDAQHYRFIRTRDGEPFRDEIREGELQLVRKGEGQFLWTPPDVGPAQLRDTLSPGNRMLGDVDPHAVLREVPPEEYDGYRYFTLSLKPELAATDAAAQRDLEQRFREAGATMLPVAVDGEVTVDSLGNRTSMRIVYRYRVRNGARWETAEVTKTYVESRAPAPEGVALDIPTEAAILLAEARDAAPAETGPPR